MKKKAFSIAEAFITLAIVGVAIGMAAPLVSKQMKNANLTNAEILFIKDKLDKMSGGIMFFEHACPRGWTDMSSSYAGRYVRIAGKYNICDKQGESASGSCVSAEREDVSLAAGTLQGEATRRVWGVLPGNDANVVPNGGFPVTIKPNLNTYDRRNITYVETLENYNLLGGAFGYLEQANATQFGFADDYTSRYWPTTTNPIFNHYYVHGVGTYPLSKYVTYLEPADLSDTNSTHYTTISYLNSFDNARQVYVSDENRPKTVVLKACKMP